MSKNVIVTGGEGFIGSYVTSQLLDNGYHVRVLDNYSKPHPKLKKNKDIESIKIDLRDKKNSRKYFKGFDKCIHLAALIGGIGYFHKFQAEILSENNKIYSTVFELCAEFNYKKIVYISSSMVFESTKSFPSKEEDLSKIPMPKTSYGFSKLIGEIYCKSFFEQFGLPYMIVRPFNAYGINEYPEDTVGMSHVIPDLIYKILKRQYPLEILGNGNQTRSFTHVSDIARGIILSLESELINENFNLGSNKETKILDLARLLFELSLHKKEFKYKLVEGFEHDVKKRIPDANKAKKILKWEPVVELKDALPEIIAWIKNSKNL